MDIISRILYESKLNAPELVRELQSRFGVSTTKQALYQAIQQPPESVNLRLLLRAFKLIGATDKQIVKWLKEHIRSIKR